MAAGLKPDDILLEYDMLPLVLNDDILSSSFSDVSASSAVSSHVENVLVNCSVDVSIAVSTASNTVADSSESCSTLAGVSGGAGCCLSATAEPVTNSPDEFTAFLLDNEQFLRDMEQVLTFEYDSDKQTTMEPQSGTTNIELDVYNDLNMIPSPCPSVSSTSPCVIAVNEFGMESSLVEKQQKEVDESTKKGYNLLPLQHRDVSLSEVSETSLLGHTDDTASASPPYIMAEKTNKECSAICEEDEMMEEEAMEDEMDLLEKEAKYLDAQVIFLQSCAKSHRPQRKNLKQHRPRDTKQPKLLAKSQEDNQLLIDLVAQEKVYQENFRAMLALAPVNEVRMALMTPMESYIRLGKDLIERRKTILSLREEKLDMTYKFIEQKAAGLDVNEPYQYSDVFEKFGKRYCVDFAIFKYDDVSVFQVGRAIYEQIKGKGEVLNSVMGSTTVRESFDAIKCNFMHQRIVSSMKWEGKDTEKMPDMESNAIFYCRFGDNVAVLSTDYIDQDDLHPYDALNRIRRDVSSGVVLSGHTDANGKKFVVMKRYLLAKYHMYPHKVSQEQQDRFFTSIPRCPDTMKTLIVDSLQRNETSCPCAGDD
ncbi:unnamed protein product [Peronospora effusa]|nr:unnamed protein product [Peronospora effusa]